MASVASPPRQRRHHNNNNGAAPSSRVAASGATNREPPRPQTRKHMSSSHRDAESRDPKMIGPWRIGKTIGKGSSGRVKIGKHTQTGQLAAVKIVPKQALLNSRMSLSEADKKNDKMLLGIEREIVIMKLIEHPNVMRLYDVWETTSDLYLVLEYVEGGELFDYLVNRGRLHADEALHYFQQIIHGVDYCHRFNICHRDLKPENLLLDKERNIKIADFGMAALERNDKMLETSCGSPHYASPEIVAGRTYHGSSSDIWSCGIILFALLTGRLPFDDENIRNLLAKVKHGKFAMPQELPADAKNLISRMLEVDPNRRITMEGIQSHPWFTRLAPRPIGPVLQPPTPDQLQKPIGAEEDVDMDIMQNLKTLWHGTPQRDIMHALTSEGKSWLKVFYILLLKYRTKQLENFNMDDDDDVASPRLPQQPGSRSTTSKTSEDAKYRKPETAVLQPRNPQPSRPAPPVPSQTKPARPPSPVKPLPVPKEVSSAGHSRPSSRASARPPHLENVPTIQLQQATPSAPAHQDRASVITSAPPSPTPSGGQFDFRPGSPNYGIQIPQTGDAAMQRFFHDIVDQLSTISTGGTRPSSVISASTAASSTPGSSFTPGPSPDMQQPATFDDPTRFEDAEEEDGRDALSPPVSPLSPTFSPGSSPATSPRLGGPASLRTSPNVPQGHAASARRSARTPVDYPPGVRPSPRSPHAITSAPVVPTTRANKENAVPQVRPPLRPQSTQPSPAALGLAIQSPGMDMFGGIGAASATKERESKKLSKSTSPAAPEPLQVVKGSWFANLFNWKQLTYTLRSRENAEVTRRECARLLESMGARIVLENADGAGILRCRVTELQGTPLKPVRFKVELTAPSSPSSPAIDSRTYCITSLSLSMEKGAHSTFKQVYNTLRRYWVLDTSRTTSPVL